MKWREIKKKKNIFLYAGDLPLNKQKNYNFIGLSLKKEDEYHIKHDITKPMKKLPDNCVNIYQCEDVFEHIEFVKLKNITNEIYRVLKPEGLFRLSMPDYRCDFLYNRSSKDKNGNILFDPKGGGRYENNKVIDRGHVWFPKYEIVKNLLESTRFTKINFLHYYNENNESISKKIDYSKGYISRTPDNDIRVKNPYRVMSIVVDLYK